MPRRGRRWCRDRESPLEPDEGGGGSADDVEPLGWRPDTLFGGVGDGVLRAGGTLGDEPLGWRSSTPSDGVGGGVLRGGGTLDDDSLLG